MSMRLLILFGLSALAALLSAEAPAEVRSPTSATDAPIALNQWYTFSFGGTVGSSFNSGAGFTLGTKPGSIAAPAPPWTFTLPFGGSLTVVDGFLSGDRFDVTDSGAILGDTSVPIPGANCGNDITACLNNPDMSKGVFALAAGTHTIDGTLIASSPVLGGAAFFDVTAATAVPDPASFILFATGLLGLALVASRRKCHERARSTAKPMTATVRPMPGLLAGLVFLTLTLSGCDDGGTGTSSTGGMNLSSTAGTATSTPGTSTAGTATNSKSPPNFSSWLEGLGSDYKVVQGTVFLLTNSECPKFIRIFGNCFGQNPATPYIIPQPPIEDAYVDPIYGMPFDTPGPNGQITNIIYRLSDQDALVTIVSYPPKAAYFGYISYVFTGEASRYADITLPTPLPILDALGFGERIPSPDPKRFSIFGSIGNDVNNVVVQNQLGVSPWSNAVVVYITTSNQNLAAALKESAQGHGIDSKSIFIEPVGSSVITGDGSEADDMLTVMRYAIAESGSDAANWISPENLGRNVLVYKVSNPTFGVRRYGANAYTRRSVNTDETAVVPSLRTAMKQLATLLQTYLTARQPPSAATIQPIMATTTNADGVPNGGLVGSVCIHYGTNCLGDDQDTSTYAVLPLQHLGLEETVFVVGVNHNAPELNNTRYVSVAVYNTLAGFGVASSSQTNSQAVGFDNSGSLNGSAEGILRALGISIPPEDTDLLANLPNLYVTAIARDVDNPNVAAARQYTIDLRGTSLIPINFPLSIAERSYIVPSTTTGGDVNHMLYPLVVAAGGNFFQPK